MLRRFQEMRQPLPISPYGLALTANYYNERYKAFRRAKSYANGKGIANVGAGCSRGYTARQFCNDPKVVANIDIEGGGSNFYEANLDNDNLPFSDGQFGCVFASHILEHLDNWESALDEWCRIADHVVVVLPHPISIMGHLSPDHKQHFTLADHQRIRERWPQVEVYT